jgi:hypothetical protein
MLADVRSENAKMHLVNLNVHRRAWFALQQLDAADQQAIMDAAESLRNLPPDEWPADRVQALNVEKGRYLLNAGSDWRALLLRSPSGELEIADVMPRERLEWMSQQLQRNGETS